MKVYVTTTRRKYDFSKKDVTNIVEREGKNGITWFVLKCGDDDLARIRLDEIECVIFK